MSSPNPFDSQTKIAGVKNIIAVSSGKGGVGKSTVSINLALALSKKYSVGLMDADIYGPSLPRMSGTLGQKPGITETQKLLPIKRYGIPMISMGHLIDEEAAVVWRGPMLYKAMDQFLRDVTWGELDFLIVDLPPGTGDVQLTLAQKVPITTAICVTTPQNIALADVKKAVDMWKRVSVPVLGLVENMAYMLNPVDGQKMELFPKGDLNQFAKAHNLKLLGEIAFNPMIGKTSEAGIPIVEAAPSSPEAQSFFALADSIADSVLSTQNL